MSTPRWVPSILLVFAVILMVLAILPGAGPGEVCALPLPGAQPLQAPAGMAGHYCGGDPQLDREDVPNLSLDLNRECKALHGALASAATTKQDAYGWVCNIPGKASVGLNMQAACGRQHGSNAIATLVGIGANDWRCLRPADVSGHVVPVLLFPVEKLNMTEASFVTASLQRLQALMGGIRRFYRERTSAAVRGTNAFVLLTSTSAKDWQNLALCTDQAICTSKGTPVPFDRYGLHNRVKNELANGRWNVLAGNSSVRIGGFATLGSSYPETPTWLGAASDVAGSYFSQPPSNSNAACTTSSNSPQYENAFYAAGHEFGHTMGLIHTDQYPYNDLLLRPTNWQQSIMYQGNGTNSLFFPFEAAKLLPFLTNWR